MPDMDIQPFDHQTADQEMISQWSALQNSIQQELLPDDPPTPLEEHIQRLQHIPPFIQVRFWAGWDRQNGQMAAAADALMMRTPENQHMVQFNIRVLPAYRRQGVGRQLLGQIVAMAEQEQRRLLITSTSDRIPAGEAFMQRLGAQQGWIGRVNQLCIAELDRSLLQTWQAQAQERAADFALGLWEGAYPEEEIEAIARLWDLLNQQPMGDLDIEDIRYGPEQLRQIEESMFTRGTQRWTLYAYARETGQLAGYTELMWHPNKPEVALQGMTGVFPEYRRLGLGRWLKAAMLDKLLQERPQVRFVRTQNANSNRPMLNINEALGFKPYASEILWQVALQKAAAYVRGDAPGYELDDNN